MPKELSAGVNVVITVADSELPNIDEIAIQLQAKGLNDAQVLQSAGIILGKAHSDIVTRLKLVAGISAIEIEGVMRITPPNSDIQ